MLKPFLNMEEQTSEIKLDRSVRAHGNLSEYVPIFFSELLLVSELLKNRISDMSF